MTLTLESSPLSDLTLPEPLSHPDLAMPALTQGVACKLFTRDYTSRTWVTFVLVCNGTDLALIH